MSDASPFWRFSLGVYRRPGVPDACLALQDEGGADVNVVLFLLWLAMRGRATSPSDIDEILECVEPWRRRVVAPLREARRASKTPPRGFDAAAVSAFRNTVKRVELESERLQQDALFRWRPLEALSGPVAAGEALAGNLDSYEAALGRRFPPAARRMVAEAALAVQEGVIS
jgi:uncharacterized protein (TIGR02444 family)